MYANFHTKIWKGSSSKARFSSVVGWEVGSVDGCDDGFEDGAGVGTGDGAGVGIGDGAGITVTMTRPGPPSDGILLFTEHEQHGPGQPPYATPLIGA